MTIKDVTVTIDRQTTGVSQAGFGVPLILSTEQEQAFTTYTSLDDLSVDFDEQTEAYAIANALFSQNPRPAKVSVLGVVYEVGVDDPTALTSALNDNAGEDFYFLLSTVNETEEVTALSEWADSQKRLYFYSTDDETSFQALESDNTVPFAHKTPTQHPAAAWIGRCAPELPGSITWKFKTLNGITESGYTPSEQDAILADGGNVYIKQGGVLHTYDGRASSGEYIDVIRSQHYVEARIKESVFQALVNANKVPYTSAGVAVITSAVESVLQNAYNNGVIADDADGVPQYSVTAPSVSNVSAADKANRILPDVHFEFTLAGAIHEVHVNGVISL